MIVAIVRFPLPQPMSVAQAADAWAASALNYQTIDGLIRKHFLLGDDGRVGGGVYLWASRAQAEAMYTEAWADRLTAKFGRPTVEYFVSPVTVTPESIEVTPER